MGIDEHIKKACEQKRHQTVIALRVNDRQLEMIDRKAVEIGEGTTRADILRGALISNGIIE